VRGGGGGHDRERPVPASHAKSVCAACYRCPGERWQVLAGGQDDNLDTQSAGPLNDAAALGRTPAGPGIDEQDRLSRAAGDVPAVTQLVAPGPFSRW
jgi:hypothetical protein